MNCSDSFMKLHGWMLTGVFLDSLDCWWAVPSVQTGRKQVRLGSLIDSVLDQNTKESFHSSKLNYSPCLN